MRFDEQLNTEILALLTSLRKAWLKGTIADRQKLIHRSKRLTKMMLLYIGGPIKKENLK